jgi:predicted RNA-binding protein with PIN domain
MAKVSLIIDGYNQLHASGILPRGIGPGTLERARTALLNFLAESLTADEASQTTVVFDAHHAPKGLGRVTEHRGISVQFAPPGGEADDLIEQLIRADSAPRKLVVVSSDHRLHRAAKRRKATPVDSDRWYAEILKRRLQTTQRLQDDRPPRDGPLSDDAVAYWLQAFGDGSAAGSGKQVSDALPPTNPFPPGYADEIRGDSDE